MIRQYELVERVRGYDPGVDEALLNRAYVYAMRMHGSQKRASGDPYFSHPLEVAGILADYKFDLPPTLVSRETELINRELTNKNTKNKDVDANAKVQKEAEKKVKIGIVLSQIGMQYKINVSNKEIETELARICMQYPGKEKEIIDFYKNNPAQMNSLKSPIFENKVIKLISEKANVEEKKVSSEELNSKIASIENQMLANKK